MFRFLAKTFCGSFVLLMTLLWSTSGQAECMQCSAPQGDVEGNCYFSDGNGFINCSRNSCSGNCKKQPYVCPEWPCWLSETINPGDEKSGPLKGCGGIGSGTTLTSTRTAGRNFPSRGWR